MPKRTWNSVDKLENWLGHRRNAVNFLQNKLSSFFLSLWNLASCCRGLFWCLSSVFITPAPSSSTIVLIVIPGSLFGVLSFSSGVFLVPTPRICAIIFISLGRIWFLRRGLALVSGRLVIFVPCIAPISTPISGFGSCASPSWCLGYLFAFCDRYHLLLDLFDLLGLANAIK
ncbi:hypothetical protein HG531_006635 [Fusarium graminearum]|nr:hypothetical protein HG531_006635 [Fusarium graminearum]